VLACDGPGASRRSLYSGTAAPRLCRRLRGFTAVVAVLNALALAGCSYQLAAIGSSDESESEATGSIARSGDGGDRGADHGVDHGADPSGPAARDLAYARAAASEALGRAAKDSSLPWQNPQTGAGGNITPLDTTYTEAGQPCRDFLLSYVHAGAQEWLQGAACRTASGAWEVKRLKPLRPT